jgi:hypothetical protein
MSKLEIMKINAKKNKYFISLIFISMFFLFGCDTNIFGSNDSNEENIEIVQNQLLESLDNNPNDYDACLGIISENIDLFENKVFDSTIAIAILDKFSEGKIIRVLEGSNLKFSSKFLNSCIATDSAEISFQKYDEGVLERGFSDMFSGVSYPIVDIKIRCRVVKRAATKDFSKIEKVMSDVVKNFQNEQIFDIGEFIVYEENVAGPLSADDSFYKTDVNYQREIILRSKLWSPKDTTITNKTERIFTTLNALKQIDNLKIDLKLVEYEYNDSNGGGQSETVYTGPRGGKYVMRNGKKRYLPKN